MNKIGDRIKELREIHGISANKLAKSIDIDPSSISKIENGVSKPSIDLLIEICDFFDISMSDFFSEGINTNMLSHNIKELLTNSQNLTPEQIEAINILIKTFKK